MQPTEIDILIPFKNAAPWLEDCLYSIQRQSHTQWKCHLIDDHSADESYKIAERFSSMDSRFFVYSNQGNGIVAALHTGLSVSSSKWVTRMDADDIMPPEKLCCLLSIHDGKSTTIATGKVRYFSVAPISEGYRSYELWINERIDRLDHWQWVYRECVIASANWLAHRSQLHLPSDRYPEDYGLVLDWYHKGLKVVATPHVTHLWREHPNRTSRHSNHYGQEAFFELKLAYFLQFDRNPKRPLVVMGENQKSKMTCRFLDQRTLPYTQIGKNDLRILAQSHHPQVLVSVFPAEPIRSKVARFLKNLNLAMGEDWWWL